MSQRVFIKPGEVYFGEGDVVIETVLGPCIAITLHHRARPLGGMCHFQLPLRPMSRVGGELDGRYGEEAFQLMLAEIRRRHTRLDDYEAKVFGGARSLERDGTRMKQAIGENNVRYVQALLTRLGVSVACSDLHGVGYRYLRFELRTGDVWVRRGTAGTLQSGQA